MRGRRRWRSMRGERVEEYEGERREGRRGWRSVRGRRGWREERKG